MDRIDLHVMVMVKMDVVVEMYLQWDRGVRKRCVVL